MEALDSSAKNAKAGATFGSWKRATFILAEK